MRIVEEAQTSTNVQWLTITDNSYFSSHINQGAYSYTCRCKKSILALGARIKGISLEIKPPLSPIKPEFETGRIKSRSKPNVIKTLTQINDEIGFKMKYFRTSENHLGSSYNQNQEDNHVVNVDGIVNTPGGIGIVNTPGGIDERANGERGRNIKRDISQLAKALEMNLDSQKTDNNGGGDDDNGGYV
ncbi:hypothetical protein L2E82_13179 [Cichorium intybus]|uniref:Uncharacterized protein n=1 Tax=Cichorium intybus TaxID=13427 RepID=A0ACB9GK48_CICIN|nr:hypothetical protein L2E82_13179 [Cichorium intybus]